MNKIAARRLAVVGDVCAAIETAAKGFARFIELTNEMAVPASCEVLAASLPNAVARLVPQAPPAGKPILLLSGPP